MGGGPNESQRQKGKNWERVRTKDYVQGREAESGKKTGQDHT